MKIMQKLKLFRRLSSLKNTILLALINLILLTGIIFYCKSFLEPKAYDFLVKLTANKAVSSDIVVITIDDESINKIGRWPWNRLYYADIIEYLEKYSNAKTIAFDSIITSSNNPIEDKKFIERIKKYKKLIIGVFFTKSKNNLNSIDEDKLNAILEKRFSVKVRDLRAVSLVEKSRYSGFSYILKGLLENSANIGSVLSSPDKDGIIRKFEPIFYYNNKYYLSLPLAVYIQLNPKAHLEISENYIKINNHNIRINSDQNGSFAYINWYKPLKGAVQAHKSYSAWQIIKSYELIKKGQKPLISPETFKNKIILIGTTATTLKDIRSTSLAADHPGVDIQATCINNLLDNKFMYKPSILSSFVTLAIILTIVFISISALSPLYSAMASLFIMLGYFHLCLYSYANNYAIDVITPHVIILYSLSIGYGFKFFNENKSKNQIQTLMAKYVSSDVMNAILKDIEGAKLGGKRAEITVLFADIRNFTAISESLEPEKVSSILNTYFSKIVPIILKNNGMINKFMGDAVLAVFGAPVENDDHPKDALKCALEIMEKLNQLQQIWKKEGKPHIDIGIGINTGVAFVGNIGCEDRLEYTVIGDTVNIAYRLDSLNKQLNTKLLISSYTYEKIKDIVNVNKIENIVLKGKTDSINVYEVKDLKLANYE